MQTTGNYGLKKPDGTDTVDIDVINGNMDTIDTKLKNNADSIGTLQGTVNSHLGDTTKHIGYAVTTNSGNAYSATIPNLTALTDGLQVRVKFNSASTSAATLNINSLGAKSIVDYFGNAVTNIRQNLIANLCYEAASGNFILQGKGGGGNATSSDLLSGKTATVDGGQITGNMTNYGNWTQANNIQYSYQSGHMDVFIPKGAYLQDNGSGQGAGIYYPAPSSLASANIKAGASIFGVNGKSSVVDTADATATTSDKIVNGYSAYANGVKVNGSATIESLGGKRVINGTTTSDINGEIRISSFPFNPSKIIISNPNPSPYEKFWALLSSTTLRTASGGNITAIYYDIHNGILYTSEGSATMGNGIDLRYPADPYTTYNYVAYE